MIEITSRKNRIVTDTLALHNKKARDSEGLFFTEGAKLLGEALGAGMVPRRIFATDGYISRDPDVAKIDTELIRVTRDVYDKMTDESSPEGVLAVFEKRVPTMPDKHSAILLLECIRDPGNLGTLIRCAVAFGIRCVVTVGCADIYNPKTVRATMGAVFKMPCFDFGDIRSAVAFAREYSDSVIAAALHADSISIDEADTSDSVLMIGSEGSGLSEEALRLADRKVIIPIENIESLNASVAGAICMYDAMCKRKVRER